MRIERVHVDGFGHLRGTDLELSPTLTVVHGENEAGKSTLLAFIRAVLFGFPSRKSAEQRYEVASGPWGGELLLQTDQGPLLVRRMGGRKAEGELTLKGVEGAPEPPTRLEQALHGVSREVFFQMFAFSLAELSTFDDLARQSSVTEALFAAGMQGAKRLPEVTSDLRKRTEEMFGARAAKRPLNQVLSRIEEIRSELEALGDRPARYFELQKTVAALDEEVKALEGRLRALRMERERLSALHQIVPDLLALERLRAELQALPSELDGFPPDGVARLEAALNRRRAAAAQLSELSAERDRAAAEQKRLEGALLSDELARALRAAEAAFSARQEVMRSLPRRRADIAERRRHAQERLAGFGLMLDEAGLLSLDVGAAARSELASLSAAVERAARAVSERESELRQAVARADEASGEMSRRESELSRLCATPLAELRRRHAALQRLPVVENELRRTREEREARQREGDELKAAREVPPSEPIPAVWIAGAAGVGIALVVLAAVFSGLGAAVVASVFSALLVGALAALWRRSLASHKAQQQAFAERAARREAQLSRLTEALARFDERLSALAREQGELRAELAGISGDFRAEADRTGELIREAERREQLLRELEVAKERSERLGREADFARARLAEERRAWEAARSALDAFLMARGLPTRLGAEGAASLCADLAQAQMALRALQADEAALEAEARQCEAVSAALLEAARAAGIHAADAERASLEARTVVEERAADVQRISAAAARVDELGRRIRRAESEHAEADAAVAGLLERAGVSDEEAFRSRAQDALRRERLKAEVRTHRAAVEGATRQPPEDAAVELANRGGPEALASRLEELGKEIEALAARQSEAAQARGSAQNELSGLEADRRAAELRAEEEELVRRATVMARQYARDRLGLVLLAQARQRFEEEQQPQVIKRASHHFAQLTGFRYGRVFVPAGETMELRVIDAQNNERGAEQLSRGTREQLYLAFRLAVIEDFAEKRGALPIILDDILVNFDPSRAKNAVKVLARVAERNQVIAFTCHPWLRELFSQHGARVIELRTPAAPVAMLSQRLS